MTFVRHSAGHMSADCTCSSHAADRYCDHCLQLIDGDTTNLVSDNELEVEVLGWWMSCMDLKQTVEHVQTAQRTGRVAPASAARIFAHWAGLSAGDFVLDEHEAQALKLGAA